MGACDGQLPRARVDRGGLLRQGVQGSQEVLWTGQSLPIFILLFSDLEQVRPQWGHNNKAEVSLQIPGKLSNVRVINRPVCGEKGDTKIFKISRSF